MTQLDTPNLSSFQAGLGAKPLYILNRKGGKECYVSRPHMAIIHPKKRIVAWRWFSYFNFRTGAEVVFTSSYILCLVDVDVYYLGLWLNFIFDVTLTVLVSSNRTR